MKKETKRKNTIPKQSPGPFSTIQKLLALNVTYFDTFGCVSLMIFAQLNLHVSCNVDHNLCHIFTFLDNMTAGFLLSLAGANGEKVADMPTWVGQTLPMEEVLVVPNRVKSVNSLPNQAGVSTATNAGTSTSPD